MMGTDKNTEYQAREMIHQFRALDTLKEDLGSIPSTCVAHYCL